MTKTVGRKRWPTARELRIRAEADQILYQMPMTKYAIAKVLRVDVSTINRWARGSVTPTPKNIQRLCDFAIEDATHRLKLARRLRRAIKGT